MGANGSRSKNGSESPQDTGSTASSSQKSALEEEEVQESDRPSLSRSSSPHPSAERPYRRDLCSKTAGLSSEQKAPEQQEQKVPVQRSSTLSGSTSMTQETLGRSEPSTPSIPSPTRSSTQSGSDPASSTRSSWIKQDGEVRISKMSDVKWRVEETRALASKWQSRFDKCCSKRDGILKKDQYIRDGVIEEAIAELQEWGLGDIQHGHGFLHFMFFALTGLFTGPVKNGDQSARFRRNVAVQKGLLEMLLATSRENMKHMNGATVQHCILGTLHQLLSDHGDDIDVFKRQTAAVSLGDGGVHTMCVEALEAYPTHEGVKDCVKTTLTSLGPALRKAGLMQHRISLLSSTSSTSSSI